MMRTWHCTFIKLALLLVLIPTSVVAAKRSLYWDVIEVKARLADDGLLHVVERQTYVFDGAWNGGERTFRITSGQQLTFHSLTRIDPETGRRTPVKHGSLDKTDRYNWAKGNTQLRWRSRLPSDRAFAATRIIYELDYTLSNILIPQDGGRYLLDHDFAFPDRQWPIEQFVLDLELDPVWQTDTDLSRHLETGQLLPGRSVILRGELLSTDPLPTIQPPAAVKELGIPVWFGFLLLVPPTALLLMRSRKLFMREQALGKFERLHPVEAINRSWLEQHILTHPPEAVGAAWDETTSAAEVAAVLARLVLEGKLGSRVEKRRRWFWHRQILHLELKVPREEFVDYERKLIRALFVNKDNVTDTARIRAHYKKKGLNPADKIRSGLKAQVKKMARDTRKTKSRAWLPTLLLFVAGLALHAFSLLPWTESLLPMAIALIVALWASGMAQIPAFAFSNTITASWRYFILFHLTLVAILTALGCWLYFAASFMAATAAIGLDTDRHGAGQ